MSGSEQTFASASGSSPGLRGWTVLQWIFTLHHFDIRLILAPACPAGYSRSDMRT